MDDVARTAGCSRQTLYKHHPTREHLFVRLFVREVDRYLEALEALLGARRPLVADDLADAFAFTLRHVRAHPVVRGVLEADEHGLVAVLVLDQGAIMAGIFDGVTRALNQFVASNVVRVDDPALLGEAFVRLVASFLALPPIHVDPNDDEALQSFVRVLLV